METRQLRVQALTKRSIDGTWIVSYVAPSGNMVRASIAATDGGASVGPRLNEVLSSIEDKVETYPFQYAWDDFLNDTKNLFNARMNGDELIHLEVSISLRNLLMKIGPDDHVNTGIVDLIFASPENTNPVSASEFRMMNAVVPDTNPQFDSISSSDWLIVGHLSNIADVVDGDTIDHFVIDAVGSKISTPVPQFKRGGRTSNPQDGSPYSYTPKGKGDQIDVRFEGINAPEILEHGFAAAIQRDQAFDVTYGISAEQAHIVGQESWDFVATALQGAVMDGKNKFTGYIVLDVDSHTYQDDNGVEHELPNFDKYGRVTATVYKTNIMDPNALFQGPTGQKFYGENICKTEMVTPSKRVMGTVNGVQQAPPLAIPYYPFMTPDMIGRIDTVQWLKDLGLPIPLSVEATTLSDSQFGLGDLIAAENKKLAQDPSSPTNPTTAPVDGYMTEEVKYTETYNNQIDQMNPYDDRIQDLYPVDPKTGTIQLTDKVRIGDVALVIPPLSIEVNNTSNITKIKTLRTRQSTMIKSGASTTLITLQLYFHDLDSINGTPMPMNPNNPKNKRNYYMDGLRPLVAQFKKAPFLPIDNDYINNTLDIHEVALVNLNVQTVPGFPHSLSATLTLAQFDLDAYMPQLDRLGNAIHYPLLRWFYQQPLRDDLDPEQKDESRTWLDPIPPAGLSNDFVFQMVDEQQLIDRKQALTSIRFYDDPQTAADKFNNPTNQQNPAEGVLNPLQMQTAVPQPGALDDGTKNPLEATNANNTLLGRLYADGWAAQHALTMYNNYQAARMNQSVDFSQFSTDVTQSDTTSGANGSYIGNTGHTDNSVGTAIWKSIYGDKDDNDILKISHYAGPETWMWQQDSVEMLTLDGAKNFQVSDLASFNGAFKVRLYEQANINELPNHYKSLTSKDGDFTDIYVPGTDFQVLENIIKRGKDAEKRYVQNIETYEQLKKTIDETEASFDLYDYDIPGLICTSMQVVYENQFSQAQLLDNANPTFQFLGGQDPFVEVNFTCDEDALSKLKFMVTEVDRYARTYRTGITSGFLGLKNDLMQLFGIRSVMIENVQYRTMPGFPGHFEVVMNLCGFDKTQKRVEGLQGISSVDGTPVRSTREAQSYNPAIDQAIVDYKMKFLEIYPDLELPTYDELNTDLPDIAGSLSVYENRTSGIYVDPDFYICTPVTVRQMVSSKVKTEVTMSVADTHGIQMATSSQSPNMLDGTDEMWSLLNNMDGSGQKIDPQFSWSGNAIDKVAANSQGTAVKWTNPQVQKFVTDRKNLQTKPDKKQFVSLGLDKLYKDYDTFLKNAQPSEQDIYKKIYELIDKYFTHDKIIGKYIYNDTHKDPTDKAWQKITYSSREDMYDVNYNYIASTNPKYLTKKDNTTQNGSLSLSDYKATKSLIPRERLANIIKAIIHAKSEWKQFYGSGTPVLDDQGNAAGIMGVPLASEGTSMDVAQRLLWDWSYNMEVGFKFLNEAYQAALSQKSITYQAAPWDWMIYAYSTGNVQIGKNLGAANINDMNSAFVTYVYSVFDAYYNNYAHLYATPLTTVSLDIMSLKNGYSPHQMGLIKGNKEDFITELIDIGYRKDKKNKNDTQKWLEQQPTGDVRTIYEDYMAKLYTIDPGVKVANQEMMSASDGGQAAAGGMALMMSITNPNGATSNYDISKNQSAHPTQAKNYAIYTQYTKFEQSVEENNLLNQSSAQDIFPKLFIDMIRYDQKFRLLRAFPTFQMLIIDEGRWMTNYKLWDNLYGYNAIQSIDINKSRKIAADTAVIQMTNIYSNVTSRALDTQYGDYEYRFWDNLVWGNPNQEILDARKELLNAMYLQTGARIHLRMGYGSSVPDLPVVFNGTITEMDPSDVVQIVAQGDGLELTNVISGDPHDTNANFLTCTEPRDLICKLLTSKGNWLENVINSASNGEFFRDNPLGIMHFGTPGSKVPPGDVMWYNHEYGEAAQNIYSSNGLNTFSEYVYQDGSLIPWNFNGPFWTWGPQAGDEANIIVPFYNNTTWDIAQTIAYCSPDYIAAVMPFELRSTLFFGKPYWEAAYQYDSRYEYNAKDKTWTRYKDIEYRKPYMQAHMVDGTMDIISNGIKASAEDIYTNVIVNYNGKQTPLIYADYDIRFDKQTTTVVEAQLVHKFIQNKGPNFFTTEQQAIYYGMSAVRDFMKDMYKGELLILGDPTIKPHDIVFLKDDTNNMNGNFLVKAVTHHFNQEMGFVTSIQPDAVVVNDDKVMLGLTQWSWTLGIDFTSALIAKKYAARMLKKMIPNARISKWISKGTAVGKNFAVNSMKNQVANLPDNLDADVSKFKQLYSQYLNMADGPDKEALFQEMKNLSSGLSKKVKGFAKGGQLLNAAGDALSKDDIKLITKAAGIIENGVKAINGGTKTIEFLGKVGGFLLEDNPLTFIAMTALQMAGESIAEWYRRKKALYQAVLMMPLSYQGREYTAGITGHKGMVVGDSMGKLDAFLSGLNVDGKDDTLWSHIMSGINWLTGANSISYSVTDADMQAMMYNQTSSNTIN